MTSIKLKNFEEKMFMNSDLHIKLAAFQELQYALKVKRVNEELLEQLTSSLRWLLHYRQKYNIPLPEIDKILDMLNRITTIADKLPCSSSLPTRNQHDFKHRDDSTEPDILIRFPTI
jgi:hypothetical protein